MSGTRDRWSIAAALLALLALAGCGSASTDASPTPAATATPRPSLTPPYPEADIAAVTPADAVTEDPEGLEDDPAVQIARADSIVIAWSDLTDTNQFAQFTQRNGPDYEIDRTSARTLVGPVPWVVMTIAEDSDSTVTLHTCTSADQTQMHKDDGALDTVTHSHDSALDITLSPLTDQETAELTGLGIGPPALRVRAYTAVSGECDASAAVTQTFESWQDVAPVGHYQDQDQR